MSEPIATHRTDGRVHITHRPDHTDAQRFEVDGTGFLLDAEILNIGGRAAAFGDGATLELGGGTSEVVVEVKEDSRVDGNLVAIGFSTDAIL